MFDIGETVVYGTSGICEITEISADIPGFPKGEKKYYVLKQLCAENSIIYAPVEGAKIPMRKILTKAQTEALISSFPEIDALILENPKHREVEYRQILKTTDCKLLISLMKTLYERNESKIQNGKKLNDTDEKYFKMVRDKLFSEFSYSLGIQKDQIEDFINEKLNA